MTINPLTARPGSVVEFRCGGKAIVRDVKEGKEWIQIYLEGAYGSRSWQPDGCYTTGGEDIWDIISITPPPMTDAERLAEIAKIITETLRDVGDTPTSDAYVSVKVLLERILPLAEGRSP